MWKNRLFILLFGFLFCSCVSEKNPLIFEGPVEIFITQDKRNYSYNNSDEIQLKKKPFEIMFRFDKNLAEKMYFVQFSKSDNFYTGINQRKSIGSILVWVYPNIDEDVLNQAFLSGGMSVATHPGNEDKLFFISDYSNIRLNIKDGQYTSFNRIEAKTDFIEASYIINNFDNNNGIEDIRNYPYANLYISFVYPDLNVKDYDRELSKSVKIKFY